VDTSRGEATGPTYDEERVELHHRVGRAVAMSITAPCRFWVHVHVDKTREKPDRQPAPTVDDIAREANTWVRIIEPDPDNPQDRPSEQWIMDGGWRIVITAHPRKEELHDQPPVVNEWPATAKHTP
jgi:hypothetical protein